MHFKALMHFLRVIIVNFMTLCYAPTTQVLSNLKQTSIITQDHIAPPPPLTNVSPSFVLTILTSASSTNEALNTKFNQGNKFTQVQYGHDILKTIQPIHVRTSKEKTPPPLFQILNYFSPIFAPDSTFGHLNFHVDIMVLFEELQPVLKTISRMNWYSEESQYLQFYQGKRWLLFLNHNDDVLFNCVTKNGRNMN